MLLVGDDLSQDEDIFADMTAHDECFYAQLHCSCFVGLVEFPLDSVFMILRIQTKVAVDLDIAPS
jgi:hypothetical protein